jgi:hypothetical protein
MTQFTCKGVKQINNRISFKHLYHSYLSAFSLSAFDAEENFLFRSNVQWIHLGLSCYDLFGTKADQSII